MAGCLFWGLFYGYFGLAIFPFDQHAVIMDFIGQVFCQGTGLLRGNVYPKHILAFVVLGSPLDRFAY